MTEFPMTITIGRLLFRALSIGAWSLFGICHLSFVISSAPAAELKFASFDESQTEFDRSVKPLLTKYCAECHGPDLAEKELNLPALPPDMKATTSAARWAVVLTQLSLGKMPPKDEPQPSAEGKQAVIAWIKAQMKQNRRFMSFRHRLAISGLSPKVRFPFAQSAGKNLRASIIEKGTFG